MSPHPPLPRKMGGHDPPSSYGSAAPGLHNLMSVSDGWMALQADWADAVFTVTHAVKPKNRPGPAGAYKLCHRWFKRV